MSALVFILWKSLINTIKELLRKPAALVAYIVIAAFFVGSSILSGLHSSASSNTMDINIVKTIVTAYTIFLFSIAVWSSLEGPSFFRMADVNYLFTAPIKAGNILIYGFVKQLAINFMVLVFLALQYPNWKRMFGLNEGAGWILVLTYMLMVAITSILGMVLYSYVMRKPNRRTKAKRLFYVGVIIFVSPIVINTLRTGDILKSALTYLSNDSLRFIPLIGWLREMLLSSIHGITPSVLLSFFLTLAVLLLTFRYLYGMDTGFYEDVLSGTELKETVLQSMRRGKSGVVNKNRRYRKVKFQFTVEGSKAIFQKQLLEKRKTGIWFVSARTMILLVSSLIVAFTVQMDSRTILSIILLAATYMMLIFAMIGSWEGELSKHYIFLIPGSPFGKTIYATLPELIKILVEAILVFGITGAVLKASPLVIISAITVYAAMGAVFTYSDLFIRRVFGRVHGNVLRIFFRMLLFILIIIAVVIPAVIIIMTVKNYALAFFAAAAISLVLALLFMLVGVGLFNNPELR